MTADWARTRIEEAVDRALNAATPIGETWFYDIAPAAIPTQQGMAGGYLLILTCRNVLLTPKWLAMCNLITDSFPADEMIEASVQSCVQQLLTIRDNLLAGQEGG